MARLGGAETKVSKDVLKAILRSKQTTQSPNSELASPATGKTRKGISSGSSSKAPEREAHFTPQSLTKRRTLKKRVSPATFVTKASENESRLESRVTQILNDRVAKKSLQNNQAAIKVDLVANRRPTIQSFLKSISIKKEPEANQTRVEKQPPDKVTHYRSRDLLARITSFDSQKSLPSEPKQPASCKANKKSVLVDLANIYNKTERKPTSNRSLNLTLEKTDKPVSSKQITDPESEAIIKDILDHGEDPIPNPPLNTELDLHGSSCKPQYPQRSVAKKAVLKKPAKKPLADMKNHSAKSLLANSSKKKLAGEAQKPATDQFKDQGDTSERRLGYFMDFIRFGGANGQHKESKYVEHVCASFTMFKQLGPLMELGKRNPKPHRPVVVPTAPGKKRMLVLFDIDETLVHCDVRNVTKTFDTRTRIQISDQFGRKIVVRSGLI